MNRLLFRRDLDTLDFFQFLDAALHLFRLCSLVPEPVDECFELLESVLLILIGGFELRQPLGLLRREISRNSPV